MRADTLQQHSGNTGHTHAHTPHQQHGKVLTWQGEGTEEHQYHEPGLWNEHIQPDGSTSKPNRSCAWAEPYQLPHNVLSFDTSSL